MSTSVNVFLQQAAVWLTFGQCLNALGDLKTATEAYRQVVEMAPGHYGARVTLSSLLQQMGQNEFALDVLSSGKKTFLVIRILNDTIWGKS